MADKQTTPRPLPLTLELSDLAVASVLGRGAKGVVFLVSSYSSGETFALKVISRSTLENNNAAAGSIRGGSAYRRIWFERDVLLALRHPLLPSLCGVVSTEKIVGFAIKYCPGGDLNSLRRRQTEKMFSVDVIRFYAAELVLVLEYLHGLGIIYRDLKPENILIQENGHIMLVDFDLSAKLQSAESPPITPFREAPRREPLFDQKKKKRSRSPFVCFTGITDVSPEILEAEESPWPPGSPAPAKSNSFVGTEEYVAPEMIEGNGHDFAVDWWCLGVVLYEMLYGRTPFRGQNRKETFYRIVVKPLELVGEPTALRDLIGRLLEKDPAKRIAIEEIRRHEFFRGVSWETVMRVERPPYMPVTAAKRDSGDEGLDLERVVEDFAMSTRAGREKALEGKLEAEVTHSSSKNGHFAIF